MPRRALGLVRFHLFVLNPTGENLDLGAFFSFWPVNQIHRTERRLEFRFLRVLFLLHDVAIADTFRGRFHGERPVPVVAPFDRIVRRLVGLTVLERPDIFLSDLDSFQFESFRQIRRNETGDLQFFQIVQRRRLRSSKRKRENERAQTTGDPVTGVHKMVNLAGLKILSILFSIVRSW